MAQTKATYKKMEQYLTDALGDLEILCGNKMQGGHSNASWQDIAGTCAVNLRLLADQLESARAGNAEEFITFPSPSEILCGEEA